MKTQNTILAQQRKGENLADMWDRCKDTKWELAALTNIATATANSTDDEMRELHICAYDAAHSADSDAERDAFIEAMEDVFKRWDAQEAFDRAAYAYEQRTGKAWDSNPALADMAGGAA